MYSNNKTSKGVGKILTALFIILIIGIIGMLGVTVMKHIDGDTFTVTAGKDDKEECGDEQAQEAMEKADLKAPAKCKKKDK